MISAIEYINTYNPDCTSYYNLLIILVLKKHIIFRIMISAIYFNGNKQKLKGARK